MLNNIQLRDLFSSALICQRPSMKQGLVIVKSMYCIKDVLYICPGQDLCQFLDPSPKTYLQGFKSTQFFYKEVTENFLYVEETHPSVIGEILARGVWR